MKIKGHAAIICGGASGLGAASAAMLATNGAKIAILDKDETGSNVAASLGGVFVKVDVTSEEEVVAGLAAAEEAHGTARILVNCAGIAPAVRTLRQAGPHPVDAFRHTVDVNLIGTFITVSRFAHRLQGMPVIDGERGVMINTASIAAFDGQIGHAAYAASKAAIVGMTLPIARDLAGLCVRLVTIAPGIFETPMLNMVPGRDRVILCSQVPHPERAGEPAEFAQLVQAIIENAMLNGTTIRLDGALRLAPY